MVITPLKEEAIHIQFGSKFILAPPMDVKSLYRYVTLEVKRMGPGRNGLYLALVRSTPYGPQSA